MNYLNKCNLQLLGIWLESNGGKQPHGFGCWEGAAHLCEKKKKSIR
jgi:hypothetical protein